MTKEDLERAIDFAYKKGLPAVADKAFVYNLTTMNYQPRARCLMVGYSSGEAVVCSVLLALYFEWIGTPDYLEMPEVRTWTNSIADLVWPGAYYFVHATRRLTDMESWNAIKAILPGTGDVRGE